MTADDVKKAKRIARVMTDIDKMNRIKLAAAQAQAARKAEEQKELFNLFAGQQSYRGEFVALISKAVTRLSRDLQHLQEQQRKIGRALHDSSIKRHAAENLLSQSLREQQQEIEKAEFITIIEQLPVQGLGKGASIKR